MLTQTGGIFGTDNYTLQSRAGIAWCLQAHRGSRKHPTGLVPTLGCPQLVMGREKGEDAQSVWLENRSCELSREYEQQHWDSSSKG